MQIRGYLLLIIMLVSFVFSPSSLQTCRVNQARNRPPLDLLADGRHLANRAQEEAESYRENYRSPIPVASLAERLGLYCQAYTLYSSVRPFGIAAVLAGVDRAKGPQLFCIEPNGVYWVCLLILLCNSDGKIEL